MASALAVLSQHSPVALARRPVDGKPMAMRSRSGKGAPSWAKAGRSRLATLLSQLSRLECGSGCDAGMKGS